MTSIVYGTPRNDVQRWTDRVDPLYELQYRDFVTAKWQSEKLYQPTMRVTEAGVVQPTVDEFDVAVNRPDSKIHSARAVAVFAALSEFNHLSTAQVAALVGIQHGYAKSTLEELSLAGIVLKLSMSRDFERNKGIGDIWRIDRSIGNRRLARWSSKLSALDWTLISNGLALDTVSGSNGPTGTLHNLTTNELILRAMELNPAIIGGWGERHSRMADMYKSAKFPEKVTRGNIGDGVLVTRGGKIIVIESSGSSLAGKKGGDNKNALIGKAAAWVALCAYSELDISVVFVDISQRPDFERLKLFVSVGVEKESATYVTRRQHRERGAKKIFVADGRRWWPAARAISPEFLWMTAHNASTRRLENIISDSDLVTNQNADIVRNTLAALHVPRWIKNMPDLKVA